MSSEPHPNLDITSQHHYSYASATKTCVLALINQEVEKHCEELRLERLKPQTIPTTASSSQICSDRSRVAYRTVAMSVPPSGTISSSSQQTSPLCPAISTRPSQNQQSPRPPPSRCYVSGCLFRARSPCYLMACPPLLLAGKRKLRDDLQMRRTGKQDRNGICISLERYCCCFRSVLLARQKCS